MNNHHPKHDIEHLPPSTVLPHHPSSSSTVHLRSTLIACFSREFLFHSCMVFHAGLDQSLFCMLTSQWTYVIASEATWIHSYPQLLVGISWDYSPQLSLLLTEPSPAGVSSMELFQRKLQWLTLYLIAEQTRDNARAGQGHSQPPVWLEQGE